MSIRSTVLALTLTTALSGATSIAWAAPDAAFNGAYQQFTQAVQGRESAIADAVASFEALLRQEPANPVLLAYHGAATSMQATTTWMPWKKMRYAEDGMAELDKALAMLTAQHDTPLQHEVPAVLEVRFVAANTFLAVPGFMNRGARGHSLLQQVADSTLLARAPLGFRGDVWMKAATVAEQDKQPDKARRYLQAVIDAQAPQAVAARARLQGLVS